jgi:hypothetical protein
MFGAQIKFDVQEYFFSFRGASRWRMPRNAVYCIELLLTRGDMEGREAEGDGLWSFPL